MIGWRQSRPKAQLGLPRDHAEQVLRLEKIAWLAVIVFVAMFVLIDFGIMHLIDAPVARLIVRWLLIGGTCVTLTFGLSRRTVNIFVQSVRGERAARNEAEAIADQLGESEERYRRLVELCPDPIAVYCANAIVYANQAALDMAGVERPDDFIGRPIVDFIHQDSQRAVLERTRHAMEDGASNPPTELLLKRLDGEVVQVEATTMRITFQGQPAIQAVMRDITVRKRAEAALAHQAVHDSLTGLPNRVLLLDRLQQAIATSKRDGTTLSLLLMDLDRFKEVNDTLGHHAGDLLLQQVAIRLRGALRQADTIARLGGDEFAVILPDTDATGVATVVENLRRRLQAPYSVENQPVVVGASIGVAHSPTHGDEADTLMRRADVAMYVAKRNRVGVASYHVDQDRNSPDRLDRPAESMGAERGAGAGQCLAPDRPGDSGRGQPVDAQLP